MKVTNYHYDCYELFRYIIVTRIVILTVIFDLEEYKNYKK